MNTLTPKIKSQYCGKSKPSIVVINDFYNDEELNLIWQELDFLTHSHKLLGEEDTGTAKDKDGVPQKRNKGLFLDKVFAHRNISNLLTVNRKIFDNELTSEIVKIDPIFRTLVMCNYDTTLLSYYENSDYYKPHMDFCTLTVLSYFFRIPKMFSGGNLKFLDYDIDIEIENNMIIIFPSCYMHQATDVKMDESIKKFSGYGRYCMSQFLSYKN